MKRTKMSLRGADTRVRRRGNLNRILAVALSLVMLLSALPLTVYAADADLAESGDTSGTTGDCTWQFLSPDNSSLAFDRIRISGNGNMEDYNLLHLPPWYSFRVSTDDVYVTEGVKSIGNYAFYQFEKVRRIDLPDSLLSIGQCAFDKCALTEVVIPDNVSQIYGAAFYDNTKLKKVTFGNNVSYIASTAFYNCALTELTLPESLTVIGPNAFTENENLKEVSIPASVTKIGEKAFGYLENGEKVEGFLIRGEAGSEAENYAKANGFAFLPFGARAVIFSPNGGSGTMDTAYIAMGSSYKLPECTFTPPANKQFKNWKIGSSYYDPGNSVIVSGDITVYAQWENITYCTVSFRPNGASGSMESVQVAKRSSYTLPECTFKPMQSQVFYSWLEEGTNHYYTAGYTVTITKDTTFIPQWKERTVRALTFMPYGGTGKMETITANKDAYVTLPECAFTPPEGKIFDGWKVGTVENGYIGTNYQPGERVKLDSDKWAWAIWKDVPPTGTISSMHFTCPEPVAGAKSSMTDFTFDDQRAMVGGATWFDTTTGVKKRMNSGAVFENGHTYLVLFNVIIINSGCQLATDSSGNSALSAFVNGSEAEVTGGTDWANVEYTFTNLGGSTVSGSYTSYIDSYQATKIELLQNDTVKYATASSGNSGSYSIPNVANGEYTLRVSKKNHVDRDYDITVSGNKTQDVKICPKGDIDGDGEVSGTDTMLAYRKARGKSVDLDDYALRCAEVDGDDGISGTDVMLIYRQARGKNSLF